MVFYPKEHRREAFFSSIFSFFREGRRRRVEVEKGLFSFPLLLDSLLHGIKKNHSSASRGSNQEA
jgi:hypothetical protein